MKTLKSILFILVGLTLYSVQAQADKNTNSGLTEESEKQPEIVVENKSDYSKKFIEGLKEIPYYKKFTLKDNLLIIDDTDTAYFSETPKIGKRFVLTGEKEGFKITLTVKRLNYTTIDYKIEMIGTGKLKHTQSGQADMASAFFIGEESDESDSGISYSPTEFSDIREDDCYTYIRLGHEEETGPYLLGKLIKNCNDDIHDIDLDNFPMLIEK